MGDRTPILHIVRGLPGSGKTTYANRLGCLVVSPQDHYSTRGGLYEWRRERTAEAAQENQ